MHCRSYFLGSYSWSLGTSLHSNLSKRKMLYDCKLCWLLTYKILPPPPKNPSLLIFSGHGFIPFLSTRSCIVRSPSIVIVIHNPKYLGPLLIWQQPYLSIYLFDYFLQKLTWEFLCIKCSEKNNSKLYWHWDPSGNGCPWDGQLLLWLSKTSSS